jgi:hypothetical protein
MQIKLVYISNKILLYVLYKYIRFALKNSFNNFRGEINVICNTEFLLKFIDRVSFNMIITLHCSHLLAGSLFQHLIKSTDQNNYNLINSRTNSICKMVYAFVGLIFTQKLISTYLEKTCSMYSNLTLCSWVR